MKAAWGLKELLQFTLTWFIVHRSKDVPEAGLGTATFIHGRAQSELEAETLMINSPPPLVYTGDLSPGNGAAHNDKVFLPQLTYTRPALPEELTNQPDLDFLIRGSRL